MAVLTVRVLADVDAVWAPSAGSNRYQMIWHGFSSPNDSEFISTAANVTQSLRLPGIPLDWSAITAVRVRVRGKTVNAGKGDNNRVVSARIFQENGTTALTAASATSTVSTSFLSEYLTPTITGGTGRANWDNAVVKLTTSGTGGTFQLSELEVEYTYNESSMSDGFYKNREPIGHWLWDSAYTLGGTSTVTVKPNADGSTLGTWAIVGESTRHDAVNHGVDSADDTEYIRSNPSEGDSNRHCYLGLENMPTDFSNATAVTGKVRQRAFVQSNDDGSKYQIFKSDGTTALTDQLTFNADGTEITTLSGGFRTDTLSFTITGSTDKTSWDGALLKITHEGPGNGDDPHLEVSEVEITISYGSLTDTTIRDIKGKNNGITVCSPTVSYTSRGSVYDLDIADTYIKIPASKDLTFTDGSNDKPLSIALWLKTTDIQYVRMVHKGSEAVTGTSESVSYGVDYYLATSNNILYFQLFDAANTSAIRAYKTLDSSYENRWVHLVATYDGSALNTGMNLYIDGLPATSVSRANIGGGITYESMKDTGGDTTIGSLLAVTSSTYDDAGQFQDVRLYGCELAAAEVKELYSNTKRDPRFATRKRSFSYAAILGEEDDPPASTSNPQAFALFVDF